MEASAKNPPLWSSKAFLLNQVWNANLKIYIDSSAISKKLLSDKESCLDPPAEPAGYELEKGTESDL